MSMCSTKTFSRAAAALVVGLGWAPGAFAGSCCSGFGGQTICVLPAEQNYQFGMASMYRKVDGYFDPYGEYEENGSGNTVQSFTQTFGGAYRLNEYWQLGASLPVVYNHKELSGVNHKAATLGDPAVEGRYSFWEDLAFLRYRPAIAFYGGVRAPLGNSVYDSTDPSDTDAVGDGTWTPYAGVNLAKTYLPIRLSVDGSYFYPFSKHVSELHGAPVSSPYDLKTGNRIQLIESATYLFNERWSAGGGLKQLWVAESQQNGANVDGSAERLYTSMLSGNYFYNATWSFGASFETPFPFYHYVANQPNSYAMTVSVAYAGF